MNKQKVIEYTDKYFSKLFAQVANHYEFGGEHFKSLPSYSTYVTLGEMSAAAGGPEKAYKDYIQSQSDRHARGNVGTTSRPQGNGRRL